jgi:1-deoxy-D-xylulose-5-phosphate reductoisomerase
MGPKVTIDSATMMNKGLELIEDRHLFDLRPEQIDILVHPQSIVHSLVEYCDGSVIAQLGSPDMRIPIAYCLGWPGTRLTTPAPRLDLARLGALTFEEPDFARFPALSLARNALETGGAAPTVLNAANEVAVGEFLAGSLNFLGITDLVEAALDAAVREGWVREPQHIEEALFIDHNTRLIARDILPEIAVKAS